ncbi:hypothetical protein G7Y89_g12223 [Cudoniella acicularis]|uniref:Zn(2)-C6 fungal-type domain-containing protein n=1 Tax=Cudoniella acicularis TaxID=354080 RepID=A0A8H4RC89_9HELO|nr:hypothetical protein G7Y89_g12223 [Cudoniella acicularis]
MSSSTTDVSPDGKDTNVSSHHQPLVMRRNRAQLSCTQCRQGKLKCDRKQPCSQCMKKGRASACNIPAPAARRKPAVSMQNRLKHLESLVKNVMAAQTSAPTVGTPQSSSLSDNNQPTGSDSHSEMQQDSGSESLSHDSQKDSNSGGGQVLVGSNESTYVGATHWAAILEDMEDLKDYFESIEAESTADRPDIIPYATLCFNAKSPVTKSHLLASLPDRLVVDRLVFSYFNSNSHSKQVLHRPTFQKQYTQFWADPDGAPVSWLGLLYCVISVASLAQLGSSDTLPEGDVDPMEAIHKYRNCTVHALVISNFTKPGPHTIETLCVFAEAEFLISKDGQVHMYLLIGNIIRLALRMGLHRDSTKIGGHITPFQAEFRRRIWHHIAQIDLLASFHIGLPGMIHAIDTDTGYPSNLRDEDFDENSSELPPSRPESELTPATYLLSKSRLCHESGKIVALANGLTTPPYEEVMTLDTLLQNAYKKVPSFYRISPSGLSIMDSPEIIIKQFGLLLVFQKSRCMLHRRYLKGYEDPQYAYSKQIALESSMELLKAQSMCYEACLPGGPLAQDKWFVSTIAMHDFLLAAMIICMSILQAVDEGLNAENIMQPDRQGDWNKLVALEKSLEIWAKTRNLPDAPKAVSLVKGMLTRVNSALKYPSNSGIAVANNSPFNNGAKTNVLSDLSLEDSSSLYASSIQGLQPQDLWPSQITDNTASSSSIGMRDEKFISIPADPIGDLISMQDTFDWELFDDHIFPKPNVDNTWPNINPDDLSFSELNYDMLGNV